MSKSMLKKAKELLDIESKAIQAMKARLGVNFNRSLDIMLKTKGRVVVTGVGKTGIIGQKLSATLASTGTPSLFLHTAEAIHGDLGRVTADDVVVVISTSGATDEIKQLLPFLKKIGAKIIALTGNIRSILAEYSDTVLDVSVKEEAGPFGLVPTASTTAALAMTDALAVCLLELKGFKKKDFAILHPGGMLGKKLLLKVEDIMRIGVNSPLVNEDMRVSKVLVRITQGRAGSATVIDKKGRLAGIFTDGDLRRYIAIDPDLMRRRIKDVMTKRPTAVKAEMLAAEAMKILREKKIDEMPVIDKNNKPVGLLDVQDLLKAGIV